MLRRDFILASCAMLGVRFYPQSNIVLNCDVSHGQWGFSKEGKICLHGNPCLDIKFGDDPYIFKIKKHEKCFTESYVTKGHYDFGDKEFELKWRCAAYLAMKIFATQDPEYAKYSSDEIEEYKNNISKFNITLNPRIQYV